MASNLDKIVKKLSSELEKKEKEDPTAQEIQLAVEQVKKAKQVLDGFKSQIQDYNNTAEHILQIQNLMKDTRKEIDNKTSLARKFWTKDTEDAYYKKYLGKTYLESRAEIETNLTLINKFNKSILKPTKEGYKAIMNLRKIVTGQEIIYALQSKDGNKTWQTYVEEEKYLRMVGAKTNILTTPISKISDNFAGANIQVKDEKIKKAAKAVHVKSRDAVYQAISKYTHSSAKDNKLKTWEAWEAYTEARAMGIKSEDQMGSFIIDYLSRGDIFIPKLSFDNKSGMLTEAQASFSTLAFYRGGDTATFSKFVMVQNKSTSDYWEGANIGVGSVYTALCYICDIFKSGVEVDVNKVLTLFTTNFKDMPQSILSIAFKEADNYARQKIISSISKYNASS